MEIKTSVISEDEFEKGNRIILNYGHTIGHALEKITEYKNNLYYVQQLQEDGFESLKILKDS